MVVVDAHGRFGYQGRRGVGADLSKDDRPATKAVDATVFYRDTSFDGDNDASPEDIEVHGMYESFGGSKNIVTTVLMIPPVTAYGGQGCPVPRGPDLTIWLRDDEDPLTLRYHSWSVGKRPFLETFF